LPELIPSCKILFLMTMGMFVGVNMLPWKEEVERGKEEKHRIDFSGSLLSASLENDVSVVSSARVA